MVNHKNSQYTFYHPLSLGTLGLWHINRENTLYTGLVLDNFGGRAAHLGCTPSGVCFGTALRIELPMNILALSESSYPQSLPF